MNTLKRLGFVKTKVDSIISEQYKRTILYCNLHPNIEEMVDILTAEYERSTFEYYVQTELSQLIWQITGKDYTPTSYTFFDDLNYFIENWILDDFYFHIIDEGKKRVCLSDEYSDSQSVEELLEAARHNARYDLILKDRLKVLNPKVEF